jgi:multidrug resistance efflux pump
VTIRGYGQVKALNTVNITPEVAGRIVALQPRLEQGEVIPSGEMLFRIGDRDYRACLDVAHATVQQLENTVLRLGKGWSSAAGL